MASSWYISKEKRKNIFYDSNIPPIDIEKWRAVVENDGTLFWFEDTALGKESFESPIASGNTKIKKKNAHFDLDKGFGHWKVQFNYNIEHGFIWIMETRTSLRRIEKYYELAQKLEAKLFKNKTWINEERMQKIRDKYDQKKNDK
ncbi:MAG: hypothetical protein R2792_06685 [Saprospiraceae bacterium]